MGKLSREKGKRGEREVVALLKEYGFKARRGQQFKGTKDSPDVIHNMKGFFVEVKLKEQLNLHAAIDKAVEEADGDTSLVFHRKNGMKWLVTMEANEFLFIMKNLAWETYSE